MTKPQKFRRRILAAFAVFAIAAITWMLLPQEEQPLYAGIPILQYFPSWVWAKAAPNPQGLRSIMAPAFTQPQGFPSQTDTNAIPWLFRVIRRDDSLVKRLYLKHQPRIPPIVRRILPVPVPTSWNRQQAEIGLRIVVRKWAKESIPYLVKALKTGSAPERLTAAQVLQFAGQESASALSALVENLSFKDPEVQIAALFAILQSGGIDRGTFETLADYWIKRHADLELKSGLALSFCGAIVRNAGIAQPALRALSLLRTNVNPIFRIEAIYASWRVDPTDRHRGEELLAEFKLNDGDPKYRAGRYLERHVGENHLKSAQSVPVLTENLRHHDPGIRAIAARILIRFNEDAPPALTELIIELRDANRNVRSDAALAIAAIGPSASNAIPALIKSLSDPESQAIAARALGAFGSASFAGIPKLVEILSDTTQFRGSTELRANAARTLGLIGIRNDSVMNALRNAQRSSEPKLRDAAAEAVNKISASMETAVWNLRQD